MAVTTFILFVPLGVLDLDRRQFLDWRRLRGLPVGTPLHAVAGLVESTAGESLVESTTEVEGESLVEGLVEGQTCAEVKLRIVQALAS